MIKNRRKHEKKYKLEALKYAVTNKTTKETTIFRFKKRIAEFIGVNPKTLERNDRYENDLFIVSRVFDVR